MHAVTSQTTQSSRPVEPNDRSMGSSLGSPGEPDSGFCEICRTIDFGSFWNVESVPDNDPVISKVFRSPKNWPSRRGDCKLCNFWAFLIQNDHCLFSKGPFSLLVAPGDGHGDLRVSLQSRTFKLPLHRLPYVILSRSKSLVESPRLIDYEWLRNEISESHEHNYRPVSIQLLDCDTLEVVDASTSSKYIALSYVIGPRSLKLSACVTGNQVRLAQLPRTIQDAIQFVRRLGERYLWLDALCINASSDEELQPQLSAMAQIYACARATLVSLGRNHDCSIPGVTKERTLQYALAVNGGVLHLNTYFIEKVMLQYSYYTRGWCLQETLLSKRLIYALEGCALVVDSKGYCFDYGIRNDWTPRGLMHTELRLVAPILEPITGDQFYLHIREYGRRLLSRESDSFDAIRGYFNRLPWYSLWGIASIAIDISNAEGWTQKPDQTVIDFVHGLLWWRD